MKTDNANSEKDLNANPESRLNTNKPLTRPARFPESPVNDDMVEREDEEKKDDSDIELLAGDVAGSVGDRVTSTHPSDIAGVSDLDAGMRRGIRK
jgi:hypothetical protein